MEFEIGIERFEFFEEVDIVLESEVRMVSTLE